jgi:hypothetical protein
MRNKNGLLWPCLLMVRDEITNLYRGPDRWFLPSFGSFGKAVSNESRLGRKHPCIVLYNDCSFSSDPVTNMATTDHSWFWLADFWKNLLLWNPFAKWIEFGRKHPWKDLWLTYIKIAHLVAIRKQTWPPQAIFASDWLISKKSSPLKPLCRMNRNFVGRFQSRRIFYIGQWEKRIDCVGHVC